MQLSKILGVVASAFLALVLGAGITGAMTSEPSGVSQANPAVTSSPAANQNGTRQSLDQHQQARLTGSHDQPGKSDHGKSDHGSGHHASKVPNRGAAFGDIIQNGSNTNSTEQGATSRANTGQTNVGISGRRGGTGDVHQHNGADTSSSGNTNHTRHALEQNQTVSGSQGCTGERSKGDVSQTGSNTNSTAQDAGSRASTEQVNVAAPISVLSGAPSDGEVNQSNNAQTTATSSNANSTNQSLTQNQDAHGVRGGVSQTGSNSNSTNQSSSSHASTKQLNIAAPASILGIVPGIGSLG